MLSYDETLPHRPIHQVNSRRMAQALNRKHSETEEEAIAAYSSLGIRHESIRQFLRQYHGIEISM